MKKIALLGLMAAVVVWTGAHCSDGVTDSTTDGGSKSEAGTDSAVAGCTPGDVKECPCIGGGKGVLTCSDDGSRWGKCEGCTSSTDAGIDGGQHDAALDASTDASADTGHDAGLDSGVVHDGGGDSGGDAEHDSGHDGGTDSGSGVDAGNADAGADAGIVVPCGPSPTGKGGDMCDVPAGPFMMGCNSAVDTECASSEYPYHSVTVPGFKIDKYEVTASEYKACVTASGCTAANTDSGCNYNVSGKESHPINCVDWAQAKAYCTWAGKRLPTEAEWEKAARGTDGRKYPWGNDALDCDHAVHSANGCSNSSTAPVGSKPAGVSPYGAEDMVGNVWEWVEDWYHDTYTGAPSDGRSLSTSLRHPRDAFTVQPPYFFHQRQVG